MRARPGCGASRGGSPAERVEANCERRAYARPSASWLARRLIIELLLYREWGGFGGGGGVGGWFGSVWMVVGVTNSV